MPYSPRKPVQELDDFDPNDGGSLPWATYVVGRSQKFKTHTTRAVALNATIHGWYAILYRWQGSQWVQIARKCPEDHNGRCNYCSGSTMEPDAYSGKLFDTGEFLWRKIAGKITEPPELLFVCKRCYRYLR